MNALFKHKLASMGIDFTRFLVGVTAALAANKNPKYLQIIEDAASVLDAHLASIGHDDNQPAAAKEVALAEPNGGFPGAPRPGSPAAAVNGHHVNTTAVTVDDAAPAAPVAVAAPAASPSADSATGI